NSEVSFNVGLSYDLNDQWAVGVGYAQAARGKEIGDGFTIDSYLWDGAPTPVVDPELDAEQVTNIEASIEYRGDNLNVKLAAFNSSIDDVISERPYGASFYQNIGTVDADGFELDFAYRWHEVEFFLGIARSDSALNPRSGLYANDVGSIDLNGYKFNGIGNSRGDTWNLGVNYLPFSNLQLGTNVAYVDDLSIDTLHQDFDLGFVPNIYRLEKSSYTTVDVFAEWQASERLVFNIAATNLLNEQFRDHSSVGDYSDVPGYGIVVGPSEAGRDIRLSVSISF
ncbi:MAG: hemoglobin/transferrin/lactoferrin receptor protein, partial [Candidatus Azotimanducaceae bacterium]